MKLIVATLATALAAAQPVTAQDRATGAQAPRDPRPPAATQRPSVRRTTPEPFLLGPPPPAPPLRADPLPIPNRNLEAPRDRFADDRRPTWEPMLLPPERRRGQTFGQEHLRETGPDNPFDMIVPGARLRIPFE
jgi:hypothetical protein